jgi:RimJ/RimL family protein N-acetyltransferase
MAEWSGTRVLTTPRLVLRTFRRDDLPAYAALNRDPEVMRYLGGKALSREASDGLAEWANERHAEIGIGLLAVERRADGAFLGMCGLHRLRWYPDDVEVAWRLARAHWGNGYITEAATAWLDHGFGTLGLDRVISVTDLDNERSLAVMRRLGMTFDHEAMLEEDGDRFPAVIHSITAGTWSERAPRL